LAGAAGPPGPAGQSDAAAQPGVAGHDGAARQGGGTDPRHTVRATRTAGRAMRSRLLDAAARLFKDKGLAAVAISEIAAAADAFPSQITYYFRTKEALFVEAACRDALYVARAAEQAAHLARSPQAYTHALVEAVMAGEGIGFFVEALALTRRRQDLAPLVERTIERLHAEGMRAYAGEVAAHGWRTLLDPATTAQRFWAVALGVALEGQALGRSQEYMAAEMLRLLDRQADAAASRKLRVVGAGTDTTSDDDEGVR
jgi:AcrR family transcriptional regulator